MGRRHLIDLEERRRYDEGLRVLKGPQEFVMYPDHLSIRVWHGTEPDSYTEHWHAATEIIVPLRGNIHCHVEGVPYVVGDHDVLVIPSGKLHNLMMPPGSARNLLLFDPQPLQAIRLAPNVQPIIDEVVLLTADQEPYCSQIREALLTMVDQYDRYDPVVNLLCYSQLANVYAILGRYYVEHRQSTNTAGLNATPPMTEPIRQALNRVFEHVSLHVSEKLTLDDAAAVAGFSKFYFSRIFSQYTGMPFSQYVLQRRVDMAARLLIGTSNRLLDIAMQSGFSSLSTFNRVFRRFHGCTPTDYRMMYRPRSE